MQSCEKEEQEMCRQSEYILTIIAALLVMLSALFDPLVSFGIAVMFLVSLTVYKLLISRHKRNW
jgi:hypothetical protein